MSYTTRYHYKLLVSLTRAQEEGLKRIAAERDTSITQVIRDSISDYLDVLDNNREQYPEEARG